MDLEGIFKTAPFGGFEKKSVLTYIDALTEKHHAEEEELQAQIAEYTKAQDSQVKYIQKLEDQLEELEDKLDAVAQQLESERAVTPHAVNALNSQNQELEQKLSETERELNIQLERNRQLQFKVEGAMYKSQKYDDLSAQVGDAMLVAKANADKIVSDAKKKAEEMAEKVKEAAEQLTMQAKEDAEHVTKQATETADQVTTQAQTQAREMLAAAERDSTQILIDAQATADALLEKTEKDTTEEIKKAKAISTEFAEQAQQQMEHFSSEVSSFKGDTGRLRKSIEEILFVLNDRVDVMQEIVRQMESKATEVEEGPGLPQQFKKTSDEAGYFGGGI